MSIVFVCHCRILNGSKVYLGAYNNAVGSIRDDVRACMRFRVCEPYSYSDVYTVRNAIGVDAVSYGYQ